MQDPTQPTPDEHEFRAKVRAILQAMTPEELDDLGRLMAGEDLPAGRFEELLARMAPTCPPLPEDGQQ